MKIDERTPVCRQVWERAVDATLGSDVLTDPALAAHVGSCMTCFRTLAELRDAPRVAAALRAAAPALPVSDRFWDDLAARTTDAAAAALAGARPPARRRATRIAFVVAAAAAAAALLLAGRAPVGPKGALPATSVATAVTGEDDEAADAVVDVADLDEPALRRLLDHLRARGPSHVTAIAAGDTQDPADLSFDDDGLANDELVELDGPALQRIERSLAGAAL